MIETWTPVVIAAIVAMIASVATALLMRRTGSEANKTDAFSAITDKLFRLVEEDGQRIEALEKEVKELRAEKLADRKQMRHDGERIEALEGEVETLRVVNGRLSRYLGKLVRLWPQGEILPEPDEPVTWDAP